MRIQTNFATEKDSFNAATGECVAEFPQNIQFAINGAMRHCGITFDIRFIHAAIRIRKIHRSFHQRITAFLVFFCGRLFKSVYLCIKVSNELNLFSLYILSCSASELNSPIRSVRVVDCRYTNLYFAIMSNNLHQIQTPHEMTLN